VSENKSKPNLQRRVLSFMKKLATDAEGGRYGRGEGFDVLLFMEDLQEEFEELGFYFAD
jgi:hypothetical protein